MPEPRTDRLYVLIRPDEKREVEAAAKRDNRSVSDWVRLVALEAARRSSG